MNADITEADRARPVLAGKMIGKASRNEHNEESDQIESAWASSLCQFGW